MKGIVAGILCGVAGAVLWGVIAAFTGYEIGWIAWGIGALVGAGIAWGMDGGTVPGVLAVVISILAILGGKFVALEMVVGKELKNANSGLSSLIETNEEYVISWLADEIVIKMEEQGVTVQWPGGEAPETPQAEADYPRDVWAKAKWAWEGMSDEEKQEFKKVVHEQALKNVNEMAASYREEGFLASFGAIDVIFFLLAIVTAYKIGSKSETQQ
jgi:hypothetical protein